jgi:hypothetical protein
MSLSLATRVSEFSSETPADPRFAAAAAAGRYTQPTATPAS